MSVKLNKKGYIEIHLTDDDLTESNNVFYPTHEVEKYIITLHALVDSINTKSTDDSKDLNQEYHLSRLLSNMLPNQEQAERMFNVSKTKKAS